MVSYWTIKHWKSISRSHIIHPGGALVSDECWFSKGGRGVGYLYSSERPHPHIYEFQLWRCSLFYALVLLTWGGLEHPGHPTQLGLLVQILCSHWIPSIHRAMINWHNLLERNFSSVKAVSSNYTHMYKFSLRQRRVGLGAIAGQTKTKKINIGNGFYVVSRVSPLMFCNQCHVASDVMQPMSCSLWCSATNVV